MLDNIAFAGHVPRHLMNPRVLSQQKLDLVPSLCLQYWQCAQRAQFTRHHGPARGSDPQPVIPSRRSGLNPAWLPEASAGPSVLTVLAAGRPATQRSFWQAFEPSHGARPRQRNDHSQAFRQDAGAASEAARAR
jgi:hypothetical protein